MIKKIQQCLAKRHVAKQHKKLEAEFAKMKEDSLAFEEKCKLQLEDFERQAAEVPDQDATTRGYQRNFAAAQEMLRASLASHLLARLV